MSKPSEELARIREQSGGAAPRPPRARPGDKCIRPDGSIEPESGIAKGKNTGLGEQIAKLAETVEAKVNSGATIRVLDGKSGKIEEVKPDAADSELPIEERPEDQQQAIFNKVAAFLDPKLRGPVFTFALKPRKKFFVGRFPVQNEMLDVQREAGALGREVSNGDILLGIVGELLKGIFGWYPLESPDVQVFRAHINDPSKWPEFRPIQWLESRDPYIQDDEIIPLYKAYAAWKVEVQPTLEEIRFYWGRVT